MEIVIRKGAQAQLLSLSEDIADRIISKLDWLVNFFESVKHKPLRGSLYSLYKLRIGDWRVVYEIDYEHDQIIVYRIGHRRDVYS